MSLLTVGGLGKYYGPHFIFGAVGFRAAKGDKIALVGNNGSGKSTLLKIIAGLEPPTSGYVALARGARLAYLAQETRFGGQRTLWEELEASQAHVTTLQAELSRLEAALSDTSAPDWQVCLARYGVLQERFEHAGGYELDSRIERTLHGLGLDEAHYFEPAAHLSGGQRTRAALAAALLADPELLLLDEPTNHLDLEALTWLEGFLRSWRGTLLVVSHDRYFLDRVTNRTIELAFGALDGDYPAAYSGYLQLKAEHRERQLKEHLQQQAFIAKEEEVIRRYKNGSRAGQARGREKLLNRIKYGYKGPNNTWIEPKVDRPRDPAKLRLLIDSQLRSGELVLALEGLAVGYDGVRGPGFGVRGSGSGVDTLNPIPDTLNPIPDTLLTTPALELRRGQRVALMGPNGCGKSTLLRTLAGELPALGGALRLGHGVALSYYAQGHEGLRLENSVFDEVRRAAPAMSDQQVRALLGSFLFGRDEIYKRVGDLSGGERSRVALARLTLQGGNLLLLDEPTNHLDIAACEALEAVLCAYSGTLLFVSHDRAFVDALADTLWIVRDGAIEVFEGGYTAYMDKGALKGEQEGVPPS